MVTLAEELPFAAVVRNDDLTAVCSSCFTLKNNQPGFSRCTGCRVLHYCSRECQKKDWINHKNECLLLKNYSPRIPDWMCRLIARIFMNLEVSNVQAASFNGRRFIDMIAHFHGACYHSNKSSRNFLTASQVLIEYMGGKFTPENAVLMIPIFGTIVCNVFSIYSHTKKIGEGLYIGLSAHEHSCAPDAFVIFEGKKAILRSLDEEMKYSKNIAVSRISVLAPKNRRQEKLESIYHFTCTCSICSDPTKDFLFNCVRSTCCAGSYCLFDPSANKLLCFKCGKPSIIKMKEAITAHKEINKFCLKLEKENESVQDYTRHMKALLKAFEKFSKIFSLVNVNLLQITDEIFKTSRNLGKYMPCVKCVPLLISAYELHWSVGNPGLTSRLMNMASSIADDPKSKPVLLALLEKALASAMISHGPDHSLVAYINLLISRHKATPLETTSV